MDNIRIDEFSSLLKEDAEKMIGKTVAEIDSKEHRLLIKFTDGTEAEIHGHTFEDGALDVSYG